MGKAKEKIPGFLVPYFNKNGKAKPALNLSYKQKQSGVYLIREQESGLLVYIGYSGTNLYKTVYRHFQSWTDRTQKRFTYPKQGYTVKIVFRSPKKAAKLERHLIKKLRPRDNEIKYRTFPDEEVKFDFGSISESGIFTGQGNEAAPF